jgi:predicted P-loop ATPase
MTRLANTHGLLTKSYELVEGQLVKSTRANLYEGTAQRVGISDLKDLAAAFAALAPNEGLAYGIAKKAQATITTVAHKTKLPGTIARCAEDFKWATGPGVFFIDGDAEHFHPPISSAAEYRKLLLTIAPELADAAMLVVSSASSHIYHGDKQLVGARGYHAYILVQNAQDIARAGRALYERSWAAGHGSFIISAAGSLLERSVIDASIWQPERIDFAAGAQCTPPLEQRRPGPLIVGDPSALFDSSLILEPTPAEITRAEDAKKRARGEKKPEADKIRAAYVEREADAIVERTGVSKEKAVEAVRRAVEGCTLTSDFVLYPHDAEPVTVREILADPERWQGCRFADPIEPAYRDDTRIAYLNLAGSSGPYLYSHAHGGRSFSLGDSDHEWKKRLRVEGKNGVRVRDEENTRIVLEHDPALAGLVGYDELQGEIVLMKSIPGCTDGGDLPRRWRDTDGTALTTYIQRTALSKVARDKVEATLAMSARERGAFNPLQDELSKLEWDGVKRVDTWLTVYAGAHGAPEKYLRAVGRAALIGGAARALNPGCKNDSALVLEGMQGIRKSTLARTLALRDDWFSDSLPADLSHKDAKDHLRGKWIIELPELAQFRKSEIETVKAFMARQTEQYRPSYGRHEIKVPRSCWFIGSTNESEYLVDATGNRRFWPVKCAAIDIEALVRDREQLWAEAVHRYRQGERWHLETATEKLAAQQAEQRITSDPWLPLVVRSLPTPRPGRCDTVAPGELLEKMEIPQSQRHAASAKRVGAILRELGFQKVKRDRLRGQLFESPPGPVTAGAGARREA